MLVVHFPLKERLVVRNDFIVNRKFALQIIAAKTGKAIELACAFPDSETASFRRGIAGVPWFKMDETFYNACLDPRDYRPRRI